jgi:membrane-associated protein
MLNLQSMDLFTANITELVKTVGYVGIFAMIFAESGLFFGFFFPGDSLLFTAGFLASQGILNINTLIPLTVIATILGNFVGFWAGAKLEDWLITRKESFLFKKKYLKQAHVFYEKYGSGALILARFVPLVRTFVPIVAGIANMKFQKFVIFNIIGGFIWGVGVSLAGYYLGSIIPGVDKYLLPLIGIIIVLSLLPGLWHMKRKN